MVSLFHPPLFSPPPSYDLSHDLSLFERRYKKKKNIHFFEINVDLIQLYNESDEYKWVKEEIQRLSNTRDDLTLGEELREKIKIVSRYSIPFRFVFSSLVPLLFFCPPFLSNFVSLIGNK